MPSLVQLSWPVKLTCCRGLSLRQWKVVLLCLRRHLITIDSCLAAVTSPRLAIVVLKFWKIITIIVFTEITQESNVYLKILDKLITMRCSQKMDVV